MRAEFPPDQWAQAEAALVRCAGEGGFERLQVAILNLADGDLEELKAMARHAEQDYRDVLYWGERYGQRLRIELRQLLTGQFGKG